MSDQPLTDNERLLPPHLGGHFGNTNMDEATLDYLIARYNVKSMLDVGCGPGGMLDAAERRKLFVQGIDGDRFMAEADPRIFCHDYTTGPTWLYFDRIVFERTVRYDLIWCTEFVEHVAAEYQDNYLATFDAGRVLFLTAAPPGFPGHHHVNCQPQEYWIDLLSARGWALDDEATQWVRANGGHIFTQRQGLVFVRL
jgi:SAM-dependent methyltransferase